jgi:D-alanine transaminase
MRLPWCEWPVSLTRRGAVSIVPPRLKQGDRNVPEIAYVNGQYMPLDNATVHIEDRGFQFADAVYEVIRTYNGKPFALDEHLARLSRSLDGIKLPSPATTQELTGIVNELIRRAGFSETLVYMQISRGRAPRHRAFPRTTQPTIVMTARQGPVTSKQLKHKGIRVITVPDFRWGRCDIKSVALLANVLAYQQAHEKGVDDALFVGLDGSIAESTAANLFIVQGTQIISPPIGPHLLSGVTRTRIIEAARKAGFAFSEKPVTVATLKTTDEAFLTSTTQEVVPIIEADGQKIGLGQPGKVTERVYTAFVDLIGLL